MCLCSHTCVCVWTPAYCGACMEIRDNLQELVLSFHHLSPRDQTQIMCLGSKYCFCSDILLAPELIFANMQRVAQSLLFACINLVLYDIQCCVSSTFFFFKASLKGYAKLPVVFGLVSLQCFLELHKRMPCG